MSRRVQKVMAGPNTTHPADLVPPEMREQVERQMGDRERCMPSERAMLELAGFRAIVKEYPHAV